MANANKATGFSPVMYLNGADWDGRVRCYYITSADTNKYAVGDPVKLATPGDANGIQGCVLATAGAAFVGVVAGVGTTAFGPYIDPTNLSLVIAPATKTKAYYLAVVDDPNVLYEIQEGSSTTYAGLTPAACSKNASFFYTAPATGAAYSGVMLDNSTVATTSTLELKLLGLSHRADNTLEATTSTTANYQKWIVKINNHQYANGIAGV